MATVATLQELWRLGAKDVRRIALAIALGILGALCTVGILGGAGYVAARASQHPGWGAIAGVLAGVEVLAILRGPLRYAERLVGHDVALENLVTWRGWFIATLLPLSPGALSNHRFGELLTRLTDDVDTLVDLVVRVLIPAAVSIGTLSISIIVIIALLPTAGVALLVVVVLTLLATIFSASLSTPTAGKAAQLKSAQRAEIVDLFSAMADLVAFDYDQVIVDRIHALEEEIARGSRRRSALSSLVSAVANAGAGIGVVVVTAVGIGAVDGHHLNPVFLGALALATLGVFETAPFVAHSLLRAHEIAAAGARLLALRATPSPVSEPTDAHSLPHAPGDLQLIDGCLAYSPDAPPILADASFHARGGMRMGIVGPSGEGKSSLVNVVMRFLGLTTGEVRYGGVSTASLLGATVRTRITSVDQDTTLFSGTIRSNLLLGDDTADDDTLFRALEHAHLLEFMRSLPNGLDTPVGENASSLSGGQRQRLSLARALLRDPDILILDEVTAGLDREAGSALIREVVARAKSVDQSLLIVTHRDEELATLENSMRLHNGKIVPYS